MIEEYEDIKKKVQQYRGRLTSLEESVAELDAEIESLQIDLRSLEEGRSVIQVVAQNTQKNLEHHISNLVSMALNAIDPDWPEFVAEIEIQRNKTECNLFFKEKGVSQRPEDSSGGGAQDVAAFALRIAFWSLSKTRAVFWLDEPFRNVSPDLQEKTSEMVSLVSKETLPDRRLQIIMVSHQDDINYAADKTFLNVKGEEYSYVEEAR